MSNSSSISTPDTPTPTGMEPDSIRLRLLTSDDVANRSGSRTADVGWSPTTSSTDGEPTVPDIDTSGDCEFAMIMNATSKHPVGLHCLTHGWSASIEDWSR
jgi:hypothetical protein